MFFPDHTSRIPDQQKHQKEEEGENIFVLPFSVATNTVHHKIVNNYTFEQVKKIFLAKTLRILKLFNEKFASKLSKI